MLKFVLLRPLTIHIGKYVRAENGYCQKGGIFRLSWNHTSVLDNISAIPDENSRNKCLAAYNYLMNNDHIAYRHFVEKEMNWEIRVRNSTCINSPRASLWNVGCGPTFIHLVNGATVHLVAELLVLA